MPYLEPIVVLVAALRPYGRTCTRFPADLRELVTSGVDVIRLGYVGGGGVDRDAHEDLSRVDITVASATELACLAVHNAIRDFLLESAVEVDGDVIDRVETEVRWRDLFYPDPDVMTQYQATYRVYARDD